MKESAVLVRILPSSTKRTTECRRQHNASANYLFVSAAETIPVLQVGSHQSQCGKSWPRGSLETTTRHKFQCLGLGVCCLGLGPAGLLSCSRGLERVTRRWMPKF